ncbi:DUF5602 domain-containing protein [Lacibacter sediminis]|uniref:DUF5602 domain-containing protein n=1 Tax=Lacibacter sediminis TaxID=2760713 RepID=A0A7G5XHA1_9BACT|nr:DUF5602 domain-containing protein [Lacibacter sediminis]QNA44854.1 DUF5602 domain-containing protein [Lacibacter sediminis]
MKKQIFQVLMLLFLINSIFSSCKKSFDDPVSKIDEKFPENDASLVVMPGSGSFSSSVNGRNEEKYNTFYGAQVQIGNGHVRSWINITHSGRPLAIGLEMTGGALTNLPEDPNDHMAATWHLKLHQKAHAVTPFDHIMLNWNVMGHEPPPIYGLPHFDMHFYKVGMNEVMNMSDPVKFNLLPPPGYIPAAYLFTGGVPMMGSHWVDLMSPELLPPADPNYAAFTHTMIYGSYDGEVIFVEPMITRAFLQSGATVHKWYRQPMHFDPSNTYYPQRYNIWKAEKNGRHYVALDEMMMR